MRSAGLIGRWLERAAAGVVLAGAVAVLLRDPSGLAGLRESLFDRYQSLAPRPPAPSVVRIVDIDDESLARFGQWPWPRSRIAALIDALRDLGVAAVGLDLLLSEPDRMAPANDAVLAAAIARLSVVTGFAATEAANRQVPALKADIVLEPADAPRPAVASYPGAIVSLPALEAAAAGNGALNVGIGGSGIVRRLPVVLALGDRLVPSLAAEGVRLLAGARHYRLAIAARPRSLPLARVESVSIGPHRIPTEPAGDIRLFFARPPAAPVVPAWRVLTNDVEPGLFAGSIALVGAGATALQDLHPTPVAPALLGVAVHGEAIDQIMQGAYLVRPTWAKGAEVLLLIALAALVLAGVARGGPLWGAAIGGAATAAAFAASWLAFVEARLLLDPLLPAAAALGLYLLTAALRHRRTEQQQRWIRRAFASYVSPNVVALLVRRPEQLRLGGERREVTSVFSDLEGYTALVERCEPSTIVPVLNAYLDGMIRIAFDHDGTIDKIIGDAVHVIFGAPVAREDDACRAVACALAVDRFARGFAAAQRAKGLAFGRTRIGVNSGTAIVGNFGGSLRFDYTAHGDVINTAARLEGANKFLGTHVLVSAATVERCPRFAGRPAGVLLLKGKSVAVAVYEPLSPEEATSEAMTRYAEAYRRLANDDASAAAALDAVLALRPDDALARFYRSRLDRGETGVAITLAEK